MDSGRQTAARVLAQMVAFGAGSRKELESGLRLSKASISRTVDRLLAEGHLREGMKLENDSRGRRATSLHVRPDLAFMVGTDLEGRAIRACVLNCAREVVASRSCIIGARWPVRRILQRWGDLLEETVGRSGLRRDDIAGLGAGLPGVVLRDGFRTRAYLPPGQWVDLDPGPALNRLGLPVAVANNVVCVSDYERRLGVGRGRSSFLSVLVRYGIGAAIYSHGEFLHGEESFTCELSHMRIALNGPRCICGGRGCLDVFASGRTMPPASRRRGVRWERELARRARALGVAVANVLKLFHPPLVIFNGIYNDYENQVRPVLLAVLAEELGGVGLSTPDVTFGGKVDFKASMGAALRAADAFLQAHLLERVLAPGATSKRQTKAG